MYQTKIFTSEQCRQIDNQTIIEEKIRSFDLMEQAASNLLSAISKNFKLFNTSFVIVAGNGNNGGDGLALARMLHKLNIKVKVFFCNFSNNISNDCRENLNMLRKIGTKILFEINKSDEISFNNNDVIIDCIFGSGLNRPVSGEFAVIINTINKSGNYIISVDIPSGLFGEDNTNNDGTIIKANKTFTIQFPPISSMFPENYIYYGDVETVPIGLSENAINNTDTNYYLSNIKFVKSLIKKRKAFDHKGTYGHSLVVAGSYGKGGAAVLSAKSCIKSGAGLVTAYIPSKLTEILQISVPEVMLEINNNNDKYLSSIEIADNYDAIGIGPGIGTEQDTQKAVLDFIKSNNTPIVIDADAINILSMYENFYKYLKPGTILTPHPKEFERLFGKFENSWKRVNFMMDFSKKTGIIIILKGGITSISLPSGKIFFNTGGNPGMATAGSGDVLTGIITSLLGQKYTPEDAAVLGVFLHSLAGDMAKKTSGENSLIASDIIDNLKEAFICIE